ncbi:MAG: hypothetical protein ACK5DM_06620, partial [Planctomyces sp.]
PHPRPLSPVGGEGRILCLLVVGDAELAPLSPCGGEGRMSCQSGAVTVRVPVHLGGQALSFMLLAAE